MHVSSCETASVLMRICICPHVCMTLSSCFYAISSCCFASLLMPSKNCPHTFLQSPHAYKQQSSCFYTTVLMPIVMDATILMLLYYYPHVVMSLSSSFCVTVLMLVCHCPHACLLLSLSYSTSILMLLRVWIPTSLRVFQYIWIIVLYYYIIYKLYCNINCTVLVFIIIYRY